VKPIDGELICRYAAACEYAFTIEEHNISGGLFSAVAECVSQTTHTCTIRPIGIKEHYPHGNVVRRARELEGLDVKSIVNQIISSIG